MASDLSVSVVCTFLVYKEINLLYVNFWFQRCAKYIFRHDKPEVEMHSQLSYQNLNFAQPQNQNMCALLVKAYPQEVQDWVI